MTDPLHLDALGQAELVRRGELTSRELVEACIYQVEKHNPTLNAVIHPMFEKALRDSAGPLPAGPFEGVPTVLKDLTAHSAGDPMHEGMRMLRDIGWIEEDDTYLVGRLREAGFVFLGRTNVPEMGLVPTTEPAAYGPSRNPWNVSRSTGGSSGGSACAVAARMVAVAHASDGGGSIRIPASACGLVGLKPTRGRTSLGPEYGEVWAGLVAEHVVTRSVRDTASVLDCVHGPMPGDPYTAPPPSRPYAEEVGEDPGSLRIGMLLADPNGLSEVHPDCVEATRQAATLLEELGHNVEASYPTALKDDMLLANFAVVYAAYAGWCLADVHRKTGRGVDSSGCEPATWALAEMAKATSAPEYLMAVQHLHSSARAIRAWWESDGYDILLTPTIPEPPLVLGQFDSPDDNPLAPVFRAAGVVFFAAPYNFTGQPAISLPLHWNDEDLPIGVQLVGRFGREDLLIRVASQVEQARPWAGRVPVGYA